MAFLKKSLFLVLFLGLVSLSICDEEKRENEDEENQEDDEQSEMRRGLRSKIWLWVLLMIWQESNKFKKM
uniref:Atypical cationic antimicrobial peptide n=1 Tax=Phyllomedusa sauvagei TaxID=8395 RepID=DRATY_PHYSA|nr:RecName: Full=Atypical cationic antimicrobial peptide; AltName: Full=Dermaseptin-S9; Short=DRS-S9; Flags: Precursor [Phyllomedusa sauvagii]CAI99864.1 preprodermaseptin S9 [Phyllomedusa sauvagii]